MATPAVPLSLTPEVVLVAVTLILIIGFWICVMYSMSSNPPVGKVYLECPAGMCPTNVFNGEKRCPSDPSTALPYDAAFETCNSAGTCESNRTPFAVLPDGSTNELGVCAAGEQCRCISKGQCPIETMVVFTTVGGNSALLSDATSRVLFTQVPLTSQGATGKPFTYDNPNNQFCAIKAFHLNRLAPGGCIFANPIAPTLREIRECMSINPCLVGVLAFHPVNANTFDLSLKNTTAIDTVPVACVPGQIIGGTNVCGPTSLPVWDASKGSIMCRDVRI